MRVHHIENVNKVIAVLNEHGVRKKIMIKNYDYFDFNYRLNFLVYHQMILLMVIQS